ncbi:MAG: helix-turn-helix domain-containing protein [Rhodospirillaceae bacterium]|nr:helix-turn-helix domain-containing protein [Rhodospirillaceae bacterium]
MPTASISKSVARAFKVLEFFRAAREPSTIQGIQAALDYPYSSVRAILLTLCDEGYLSYDKAEKSYFPTHRLLHLGDWVQDPLVRARGLADLVDAVRHRTNETTALTTRNFIFCHFLHVRNSSQLLSIQIPEGIGLTLTNSVTGRVLLSQLDDAELDRIYNYTLYWSKNASATPTARRDDVEAAVQFVRTRGYLSGFDIWQAGVGTVAYPIKVPGHDLPMALSVSGPSRRLKATERQVREAIEVAMALHRNAAGADRKQSKSRRKA